MRDFEKLIHSRLTGCAELVSLLAVYGNAPAVFHQRAPDDTASGWNDAPQCPRLGYALDMRANPERKTSGTLAVNIFCDRQSVFPEALEPLVRETLCGVFLTPEGSYPYSLAWASSEPFEWEKSGEGHTDVLFQGTAMLFDVYAFPPQITSDPDPVLAMNHYVRARFPQAVVIGDSTIPAVLEPTAEHPVFYIREESSETEQETNTVVWVGTVLACHIFAAGQEGAWIRALLDRLRLAGEVTMLDQSPLFLRKIKADSTAAALSAGQVRIQARYGLLRQREPVPVLYYARKS